MTQFQHTLKALLEGRKTETSRIIKPDQYLVGENFVQYVRSSSGLHRVYFEKGKDYAIQPARGVRSVGRCRVEAIWRQDVRTLTLGQVDDEGFTSWQEFWTVWCKMHDPSPLPFQKIDGYFPSILDCKNALMERPAERYQAWRMTIKVLWDTVDWNAPAVKALHIEPYHDTIKE
jgi:hypothetical protein